MTIKLVRFFFLILTTVCGYYIGPLLTDFSGNAVVSGGVGFFMGLVLIILEIKLRNVSLRNLSAAVFGLIFGFFMAWMITLIIRLIPLDEMFYSALQIIFTLIFCYLGMMIAIKGKDEFNVVIPYVRFSRQNQGERLFLLDTSVIIDGRITGICEAGFLEGRFMIPRFVLEELHRISDSPDDSKRACGRRGLDMMNRLKEMEGIEVIVHEETLPEIREVDAKLVRLAKILDCPVLTNDFNLGKVAKLEGIKILNINELANAMRPVIFPGEEMSVNIKKEGKEKNQGIAFLDDGTMVVIDNAKKFIGRNITVSVASVLQTSAGRMVFANLMEQNEKNNYQKKYS